MKFKLIVIYIFILIGLSSVGIISYQGLTNMMNTLRLAVQPDERIGEITEFISLVHSGENYMRLYIITRLNDYSLAHDRSMVELQDQLNRLYNASEGDPAIITGLDSIKLNLIMKTYFHDQLIRMKSVNIMPEMQRRILMEADSMESRISTSLERIIRDSTVIVHPEERKGFLSWLFRPRKQAAVNPMIIDSLLSREMAEIRISDPIRNTLEEFTEKESELNTLLMERELGYTVENTRLTEKMTLTAGLISNHINKVSAAKAGAADILFTNTTKYIAWAGAISALLLLGMLLIITRDFQVILKTKKKLEETSKKAEKLAKAREEFLATMSHEIRTPLNSVIGLLKYLNVETMTDTGKKFLGMIGKSSDHLLKVVNEILDYSKIEAGQLHFEKVWFDPWNLIHESTAVFQKEASDKNIEFSIEAEESLKSFSVQWDPVRLRQVIDSLISNAIKFTEKGQIILKARLTGDSRLIISVKDTGIGIRKDHLRKIFDEYSQVFSAQSKNYGGTGLGLSIVKKIIDLQGGVIKVESKVNSGSEFTVSIPVTRSAAEVAGLQEITVPTDLKNIVVLVADDDEYSLLMLSKILKGCNARVITAPDGQSAIQLIGESEIDLMIADIHMPGIDGYHLARLKGHIIPCIAVSAHLDDSVRQHCHQAGFRKVVGKPVEERELLQAIRELIDPPGSEKEKYLSAGDNLKTGSQGITDPLVNKRMMSIYYQSICSALSEIQPMAIDQDFEKIRFMAHKLIPSTRHLKYDKLAGILKNIEELSLSPENKIQAGKLVDEFIENARLIKSEISVYADL